MAFYKRLCQQKPILMIDLDILNHKLSNRFYRVRIFISGGAPLDVKTQRFINVCICTSVVGGYGLTETTASTTLQDPFDNRSGTVGPLIERYFTQHLTVLTNILALC